MGPGRGFPRSTLFKDYHMPLFVPRDEYINVCITNGFPELENYWDYERVPMDPPSPRVRFGLFQTLPTVRYHTGPIESTTNSSARTAILDEDEQTGIPSDVIQEPSRTTNVKPAESVPGEPGNAAPNKRQKK